MKKLVFLLILLNFNNLISGINTENEYYISENYKIEYENFRLPNDTKPLKYEIYLETSIHIGLLEYNGSVNIKILILNDTDKITLHAQNLIINSITLQNFYNENDKNNDIVVDYEFYENYTFLKIFSNEKPLKLKSGEKYNLEINFSTKIMNETNVGFYKVPYKDLNGTERWFGATYFSKGLTRLAFPCYDEPSFKANFTLKILHGNNISAISNMDVESQTRVNENMTLTTFYETPPMSTFLIAFVVGNLENFCIKTNNVTQCIYTIPGYLNKGKLSLETSIKLLQNMEIYFGINYKLLKLDHVALPIFNPNAMENWGIIFYKEEKLLNENTKMNGLLIRNMNTLSHELVHQWFGNLVTPKWYTWFWLSEGFASMYSLKMLDSIWPNQGIMDMYIILNYQISFSRFNRPTTKFILNQTDMIFAGSGVIYSGASSILRMFSYALGEPTFHNAIKNYLQKFQYSIVEEDDFFECLQEEAIKNNVKFFNNSNSVKLMIQSWTNQEGYPILTVIRNYKNNTFTIYQESFLKIYQKNITMTWWIPINFVTANYADFSQTIPSHIIPKISNYTIDLGKNFTLEENNWLILNKQQTGYYRVNYDERNWNLIISALHENLTSIHYYNRAQLLQDAYFFAKYHNLPWETFFNLLSYIEKEENLIPLLSFINLFKWEMDNYIKGITNFKIYIQKLLKPIYLKYTTKNLENDTHIENFARFEIYDISCKIDLEKCLNEAKLSFLDNLNNESLENATNFMICHAIKILTENEFKIVYNRLKLEKYKKLLVNNIGCSNYLNTYFLLDNIVKENENFTKSEKQIILYTIIEKNQNSISILTDFFSKNYSLIQEFDFTIEDIVTRLVWKMTDEIERIKLTNFVKKSNSSEINSNLLTEIDDSFKDKVTDIKNFEKHFYKWQILQIHKNELFKNYSKKTEYHKILSEKIEKSILLKILKIAKLFKFNKHYEYAKNILEN